MNDYSRFAMATEYFLAPPIAFAFFLLTALFIDQIGKRLSADRDDAGELFRSNWASGEVSPDQDGTPNFRLYHIGIGFTIVHLAVLLIATIPAGSGGIIVGFPLLAVVGLALFALIDAEEKKTPEG